MICLPEFYLFNLREADHTKFFYTVNFLLVVWLVSFAAFRYQIVIGSVGIVPVKIFSIRPKHLNQRYLACISRTDNFNLMP